MKLDDAYFIKKATILETHYDGNPPYLHFKEAIPILHQIARDGAEAQKIAAVKKVERLMAPMGHYLLPSVIAAIRSATVKWEVPGE